MSNLVLIGTCHVDMKGPERLEKALTQYMPNIICLEQTPKGATESWKSHVDSMKKLQDIPLHHIYSPEQIERVKLKVISHGYEQWVPKIYKNNSPNPVTLYCIDRELNDELSEALDVKNRMFCMQQLASGRNIQDLITPADTDIRDFVEKGSAKEHQNWVDREYDVTDPNRFIDRFGKDLFRICVVERDQLFSRQIRKIHEAEPHKIVVALLGNQHLFSTYGENTYDLLSDLKPTRLKLKEMDNLRK